MSNVVSLKNGLNVENLIDQNAEEHLETLNDLFDTGQAVQFAAVVLRRDGSVETFIPKGHDRFAMFGAIKYLALKFEKNIMDV